MIKDFELMGNKLEFVDDSTYQIQIHAAASASVSLSSSTSAGQTGSISQVSGQAAAEANTSARRKSLASSSRDNSSSVDSSATIATTYARKNLTNLLDQQQQLNEPKREAQSGSDVCCSLLSKGFEATTSSNNRRALGESLANTKDQEQFERLILMDIEGKFS